MVYFVPDFVIEGVGYNALNKSRKDLLTIYQKLAFVPIVNTQMVLDDKEVKYFARNSKVLGGFVHEVLEAIEQKCKEGDCLLMDFPFAVNFAGYNKIVSYAKAKGTRIIFFVHDLDGIRFNNLFLNMIDSSCLDMADCLITASKRMDEVLFNNLKVSKKVKTINHDYWDYLLLDDTLNQHIDHMVCFAGNLSKSPFLSKLPASFVELGFTMYGKGYLPSYLGDYAGEYDPETLASILDGKFGLVWDGKSAKTCSGGIGKYLKINTSHKFGLYIATGKPVIVWSKGSLAPLVKEKRIGIAVNSLSEAASLLASFDQKEYEEMRENVLMLRKEVINGNHPSKVILSSLN